MLKCRKYPLGLFHPLQAAGTAAIAAQLRMRKPDERIQLPRGGFVNAVCVVQQYIIDLAHAAAGKAAERFYRRGGGKHPYRRADGDMAVCGKVGKLAAYRHFPAVHPEPAAPPEAERSLRSLRGGYFEYIRTGAVRLLIRRLFTYPMREK